MMNSSGSAEQPRPKRQKIDVACKLCRARKVKCDGARPACGNCTKRLDVRNHCIYSTGSAERAAEPLRSPTSIVSGQPRPRSDIPLFTPGSASRLHAEPRPASQQPPYPSGTVPSPASTAGSSTRVSAADRDSSAAAAEPTASVIDSMTTVLEEGTSTLQYFGSSSAGSFTRQIKAAIDARIGSSSRLPTRHDGMSTPAGTGTKGPISIQGDPDYVLPPRRQADQLMDVYWHYVDPLYPFLERTKWEKNYEGLYAGTSTDADERVFVSTLNVVFALSTQLMESLHPEQRESSSNVYFHRAQGLLRLNLWEPGSFELVQCLLLMSQYLQSTSNPHQTWMVVGAAIRTAQSLGLHLPESSAGLKDHARRELLRSIWHGCVLMDRMVSVTHGRPAMISNRLASVVPLPQSAHSTSGQHEPLTSNVIQASFFVKSVQLYEMINLTVLAFYSAHDPPAASDDSSVTGPPEPVEEDLGVLMKLDKSLGDWQRDLPRHLRFETLGETDNDVFRRQAVILHIRFLQARLLLLRPTMSRFCLDQAPPDTSRSGDSLRSRVVQQIASFCVATAQSVISVLAQFQSHDGTVGLLPAWWYRIYYLYSAATILIVARLRPDVFNAADIKRSWDEATTVLQAHEKLGESARRCVAALNILSSRVLQQGTNGTHPYNVDGLAPSEALFDAVNAPPNLGQPYYGFTPFPDMDLTGLSFDANDLSNLNMHAWELLNQ